jgi:4-amino-4-deoxy-L-arabinose transferase-like glycosyltransferase
LLGLILAIAAGVHLAYVLTYHRGLIKGDGEIYHIVALRMADGLGYTLAVLGRSAPFSKNPPGWSSVLAAVSWLGARSRLDHRLVGVAIGLGIVVVTALVGRRYFDARVGLLAGLLAAVYPGFWILEGNLLSEPLAVLIVGVLTLVVAGLRVDPGWIRSAIAGAVCGALALVRPEALALLLIVVGPVILTAAGAAMRRRAACFALAALVCGVVVAPWTIQLSVDLDQPVLLSTNAGYLLDASNCPPATYAGARIGYFDEICDFRTALKHRNLNAAQLQSEATRNAVRHMSENWEKLPATVAARVGRLLVVFRPAQTVRFTAAWLGTPEWPIWMWTASFWVLVPFAVAGFVVARRAGRMLLPLVAPAVLAVVLAATTYGDPRYHATADLGIIVLAAVGMVRVGARARRWTANRSPRARQPLASSLGT